MASLHRLAALADSALLGMGGEDQHATLLQDEFAFIESIEPSIGVTAGVEFLEGFCFAIALHASSRPPSPKEVEEWHAMLRALVITEEAVKVWHHAFQLDQIKTMVELTRERGLRRQNEFPFLEHFLGGAINEGFRLVLKDVAAAEVERVAASASAVGERIYVGTPLLMGVMKLSNGRPPSIPPKERFNYQALMVPCEGCPNVMFPQDAARVWNGTLIRTRLLIELHEFRRREGRFPDDVELAAGRALMDELASIGLFHASIFWQQDPDGGDPAPWLVVEMTPQRHPESGAMTDLRFESAIELVPLDVHGSGPAD